MASSSALDDTLEKCNGTKLARLLIDGGTETLKRTFDSIHPPANLQAVLHTNQPLLNTLRKKRVLNISQWDKLYPPGGAAPDSKTFDITLLFVLLRNICGLTAPATGWDALPPAADVSREANLARIKYYRNQVYGHVIGTAVSEADFEQYWNDISGALIALGADQVGIDLLKSSAIGETEYLALLTKWKSEEDEVKEMFCELKERVQKLDARVDEALQQTPLLEQLSKCEFAQHTNSLVDEFQKGSRKWILDKIEAFSIISQQRSRALVITALPGVGKSVLAAVACRNAVEKGLLGACHFIQHNNSQRNNPRFIIESIARQLCDSVEGFKEKLHERLSSLQDVRKKLNEMNLETLISFLMEEPLSAVPCLSSEQTFVIVIDALDEIELSAKEEFTSVLLRKLPALPKWIKFVLTSRPTKQLLAQLPHVTVVNIETAGRNNTEDIRFYLSMKLQSLYYDEPIEELETITVKLTERSRGIFLYAHFAIESAKNENLPLSETSKLFPKGISSVYEEYLTRTQNELKLDEEKFINFLEGIVAARAPLPQPLALQILGINKESRQQKKVARKALISLSLLFPEESKCISIFHKSLADWLTIDEDDDDGHDFCVKVADGHRVLAEHCLKVLRDVKNHKSFPPELSDCENYALSFGFHHMLEAGGYEEQLGECVQDLELFAAMWVARANTTSGSWWKRQRDLVKELEHISDCCSLPGEDFSCLCKMIKASTQNFRPYLAQFVLQCAVYCPSTELNSKATQLLSSSKYRNCAWVKKQKMYSFEESFHIDVGYSPRSSEHTMVCVGDGKLMTLSIESGQCLAKVELDDPRRRTPFFRIHMGVERYRVALSDKYVAVYTTPGRQLHLRDVRTLRKQRTYELEHFQLLSCCFVPGNKLAAGYEDGTVLFLDVSCGSAETTFKCPNGKPVYCTASPSGLLLTVEEDSSGSYSAVLWRSLTPPDPMQLVSNVYFDFIFETRCVSFSPDGKLVAFLCETSRQIGVIKVFDVTTTHLLKSFPVSFIMSGPFVVFIDDAHILLANVSSKRVISIGDGSLQELIDEDLFLYQYYKGTRECFAIEHRDHHTLYKLAFHNLK